MYSGYVVMMASLGQALEIMEFIAFKHDEERNLDGSWLFYPEELDKNGPFHTQEHCLHKLVSK